MEFRLTYAGRLLAHRAAVASLPRRALHVHDLRRHFHKQLRLLWSDHPTFQEISRSTSSVDLYVGGGPPLNELFDSDGFKWLPIATKENGLICRLEILMLRSGQPGQVLYDIDNRLKTVFDAPRMAKGPDELGGATPARGEEPFYVLLQDDSLITHVAVTTDALLEPVLNVPQNEAVRLVISVTIRPYKVHLENLGFG